MIDGLGSVTGLANPSSVKSATYGYDVYGALRFSSATAADSNNNLYTGRELDRESSLYNYRHRYYYPSIGRFLTKDPLGVRGGINRYAYVDSNPTNFIDPDGRSAVATLIGVVAVGLAGFIIGKTAINNLKTYFKIQELKARQLVADAATSQQIGECINALQGKSEIASGMAAISFEAINTASDPLSSVVGDALSSGPGLVELGADQIKSGFCKLPQKRRNPCQGLI